MANFLLLSDKKLRDVSFTLSIFNCTHNPFGIPFLRFFLFFQQQEAARIFGLLKIRAASSKVENSTFSDVKWS